MALKTKVRLGQISGSIPTDSESAAASTSLALDDLGDILNHMASSIKRIHGAATFTSAASGAFSTSIFPASANGAALGAADKEWSDLFLADGGVVNLGADQDVKLTHVADTGVLLNSSRQLQFGDSATHIKQVSDSNLEIEADGSVIVDSPVLDLQDDGVILKMGDDSDVTLTHVHNAGVTLNSTMKLHVGDTGTFVHQPADARLLAGSDGTIELDAATTVKIDSDSGDISFEDGGTAQLALDMDGTAGEIIVKLQVASDDLVFQNQAGQEQIRLSATRGKMFLYDEGGEYLQSDGTDLTIAGGTDIKLTAGGFVEVPANIPLAFDGTGHDDKISSDGTDMTIAVGGGDIVLDASDDIIIDAGGDMIDFKKAGTLHGSLDMSAGGDLIVKDAGGTEIFRLDGSADSLLMASTKKIEFNDATQYIHGNTAAQLTVAATDEINLDSTLIDINGAADISGNLTVQGDFIVQGSTTTVSSSNTVFQDSIIGLGVSGSLNEDWNNTGDRAIIFARGAAVHSFLPAINYDASNSEFEFGTFAASPSSGSMGAPQAGVPLKTGHLKPISDDGATLGDANERWSDLYLAEGGVINWDNGDFTLTQTNNLLVAAGGNTRVDRLEIDSASDYIDVDTDLKIIAGADVVIDPAGGELKVDGNVVPNSDSADSLGASGTAWANLYVDAIDLNGQGSISMGGTGRIDLDADDDTSIRASADDTITFELGGNDLYAMNATGINIADDKKLVFGNGNDASFEYDEDGNDVLLYAGASLRISDDVKIEFGDAGDAGIEYDENGTDQLRIHQPAAGVVIAGTNPKLVLGDAGAEDTMLVFDGNAQDYRIGLDDGTDKLEFGLGAAHGSTTAFTIDSSHVADFTAAKLSYGGTVITSTAGEINLLDGGTSVGGSITLADGDGIFVNDGGTSKLQPASDMATYVISKRQKAILSGTAASANADVNTGLGATWTNAGIAAKEVYVNGQLMTAGNDAASNGDWYPGGSAGRVKFEFAVQADDILTFVVWA